MAYQLGLIVALVTLMVFAGLALPVSHEARQNALAAVDDELSREVALVATNLEFFHETVVQQTSRLSDIFLRMFAEGPITIDEQNPTRVGDYEVPTMMYQGKPINNDFAKPDAFTAMTGDTATLFMRVGDDFLRISTSLRKADGSRAFGTMLGKAHPGYQTLLKGETFTGPAVLFGREYMTRYVPVKDASGAVIGILYVGFDFTDHLRSLNERFEEIVLGDTGYIYAIDARPGASQGVLVMHPSLAGERLLEQTDPDGNEVFRALLQSDSGHLRYIWNDEQGVAREKVSAFQHVEGWDWVVAAGSFVSEFTKGAEALRNQLIVLLVFSALLIVGLIFLALRRQLRPLGQIGRRLELLGCGDLSSPVGVKAGRDSDDTKNETQILAGQLEKMIQSLGELITGIKGSMDALASSAERVSVVATQTNDDVKNQHLETDQVATATNQLAATVQEVARSATSAASETGQADHQVGQGGEIVRSVIASMEALATEIDESSQVIGRVESESETIGSVLEVIRGIADQTNLLALNAAIEAARAGEQGRGFAVVADEVRSLALKTQSSTAEIQEVIERLQRSAKEAVAVMERGRAKAGENVKLAGRAGETLHEIAHSTSAINEVTRHIAAAADQQSSVAEEINRSVVRIRDIASSTAAGADEMGAATQSLQSVAQQLKGEIGRFEL